ncbi:protein CYTOKININ-RESPONSIVE GATA TRANSCRIPTION FACTOR 1-like [Hordeum vulgare subsp. vulgare]|uniref:Uncharacterized protein n=1 Tax=Hordeum vulgare subsp. vulgare TaxID=112509 RepID=M0UF38_HORVV|nr:protein CYTOKININ-RESPONSIVE GATA TRANSCRIPTION FACTOR 1-like [Hordeum vulgare subsp. vulgare]
MSTIYMSQLSTAFPLMEEDHHHQDHHQGHFQAFTLPKDPPILFPFVISNSSPSENSSTLSYGSDQHLMQHHVMLDQPQHMIGGSSSVFSTPFPTVESIRDDMIERSYSYDPYDMEKLQATSGSLKIGKWTAPAPAAKMRITRKTSDPGVKKPRKRAQAYEDHGHMGGMNQALGVIRTCSDCNTTKTPLWRSGPCGPKSLCNACGIRQRKARRAMMATGAAPATDVGAAKAAAAGEAAVTVHPPKVKKEKRAADVDRSLPFKKRCKVVQDHTATNSAASTTVEAAAEPPIVVTTTTTTTDAAPARDLVDTIGANWSKSPTAATASCFRPPPAPFAVSVPVQDEITDAAMLLMTLSCELVRS